MAIRAVAAEMSKALAEKLGVHHGDYGLAWSLNSGMVRWVAPEAGNGPNRQCMSLWQLYCRHHEILWERDTFHAYCVKGFIRELDSIFEGRGFDGLSQHDLDQVIRTLRSRGNSNATINRKMAALRKLCKKAFAMGEIGKLPEFPRMREKAGRIRFLEWDEEHALFAAIRHRSEHFFQLSVFLVDTGARLGEGIGLRWNDINDGRATFWVTKSGRSRTVPLTARAREAAELNSGRNGGPFYGVRQYQYRVVWNEAKKAVGLRDDPDVVPHVLRHTCASRLVRGGVDMRRVQTWLGHQSLHMTMRYAHLATNDLDACVAVLERS